MRRYYQFTHGQKITVTIPKGVVAWTSPQREGLTMTVCHPQSRVYTIFEDYEQIGAQWFDGSVTQDVRIRVEWIVGRQRIKSEEVRQVLVRLPSTFGNQRSVYQWIISIGYNPKEWVVYRGEKLLEYWTDTVTVGETVTLKPTKNQM